LLALFVLGKAENHFSFKAKTIAYEATGTSAEDVIAEVNRILDEERLQMANVRVDGTAGFHRVQFTVEASHAEHERLGMALRQSAALFSVNNVGSVEPE
jgi:hypothetical protein